MSELSIKLLEKFKGRLPQDYITAIVGLKEGNVDRRFLNDSDVHAQLLILCMIATAKENDAVRIYSGSLSADCYKESLNQSKSTNIRILVDDFGAAKKVYDSLDDGRKGSITLLPVIEKRKKNIFEMFSGEKNENHFYTVGESQFRYEVDHGLATAIANFSDIASTAKLNARFDEMWEASLAANVKPTSVQQEVQQKNIATA